MKPFFDFTAQSMIDSGRLKRADVDDLKIWLKGQRDVPDLNDEQIVCFLLSCNNNQDATRTTIKSHYRYKKMLPEFFDDRSVDDDEEVKHLLTIGYYVLLPQRTPDGSAVVYYTVKNPVTGRYTAASIKLWFMLLDTLCKENPPTNLIILCDLHKLGLMQLASIRIGYLRSFMKFLQEGLPLKLKKIYMLNVNSLMNILKTLVRPFTREEVYNMICFVQSSAERQILSEEIGLACLPSDLGGDLPQVEILHEQTVRKLREMKRFFDAEQQQRHESR